MTERTNGPRGWFTAFARRLGTWSGRPSAFVIATLMVAIWLVTGPLFDYSDTWQLAINTSTTIITFLMVFLIQHTQNRDTEAMQIKLDELIRATHGAHNAILDLEQLDEEDIIAHHELYSRLAAKARAQLQRGVADVDCPAVPVPPPSQSPDPRGAPGSPRAKCRESHRRIPHGQIRQESAEQSRRGDA